MTFYIDSIIHTYKTAIKTKYEKLIIITIPNETTLEVNDFEVININKEVTDRYRETGTNIGLKVKRLVEEFISKSQSEVVIIDFFELLFLDDLKLDPIDLFIYVSKTRPLAVIWRYKTSGRELIYSEPSQSDYYKKKLTANVLLLEGGK